MEPAESPEQRSQNFRKRRLSLPKLHFAEATTIATDGTITNDDDNNHINGKEEEEVKESPTQAADSIDKSEKPHIGNDEEEENDNDEADEKAHTFRKRRLSLTNLMDAASKRSYHSESNGNGNHQNAAWGHDEQPIAKRPRALSTASAASTHSHAPTTPAAATTARSSRILHSAEMIAGPFAPPSPMHHNPVLHSQNPLPPSQSSALDDDFLLLDQHHQHPSHEQQHEDDHGDHHHKPHLASLSLEFSPRRLSSLSSRRRRRRRHSWKTRHHHDDEDKLPFPKDVVGTYSCHGIEPIYEDDPQQQLQLQGDEEEEGDEEDDGGFWGDEEDDIDNDKKHELEEETNKNEQETTHADTPNGNTNHAEEAGEPPKEESQEADEEEVDLEPRPLPDGDVAVAAASVGATTTTAISAKINQDRGGITYPYANSERTALFSVYDGHGMGGELVSQFCVHEIQRRLEKHPHFENDLEKALRETFLQVDEALKHEPIIEPFFAGTTACVALLQNKRLTLANCGDSRAVMARKREDGDYDSLDLTVDQNPDSPEEMQRIVQSGGYVSPPPGPGLSSRVWLDAEMTQIGLAMARSLGDHAVADVGVIADPVVTTAEVTDKDDFLILATDGVWEFLESSEAVQIVGDHLDELGATKACQALIEAAASRWHEEEGQYRDDITAIVVRLRNLFDSNGTGLSPTNGGKS